MGKWIDTVKNSPQTYPARTDATDTPDPGQAHCQCQGEVEQVPRKPPRELPELDFQAREISKIFYEKGWVAFSSRLLNGEVVVFVRDAKVVIPTRWQNAVAYTLEELETLTAPPIPDREGLKAIHEVKKLFEGRIATGEEARGEVNRGAGN